MRIGISTHDHDELDIAGRDGLKAEIRAKVDSLLGGKLITGVFFPQFVIQ